MQSSMLSFICYNSVLAICRELLSIPYKWTAAHIVVKNIPSILDGVFSSFSTRELLQKNFCVYFSLFLPSTVYLYACTSTRKKNLSNILLLFSLHLSVCYFRCKRTSRLYIFMLFPFDFASWICNLYFCLHRSYFPLVSVDIMLSYMMLWGVPYRWYLLFNLKTEQTMWA